MTTPLAAGGFINNLLGGAAGTLGGTAPLQSSIDQLTQAVNRLSTQLSVGGTLTANGNGQTRQANLGNTQKFPGVVNPFQPLGGPNGSNVSPAMPFSRMGAGIAGGVMLGGAFAGYGQQQMPFQLGLNQYAAISMMGMNNGGMGTFGQNFTTLSNQPGMPISSNAMDYLGMMQGLGFLAGAPNYMSTAMGRAGFGAAAAFGLTNPSLSGSMSANLAQQIYNPMLSMRMRMMGYNATPRAMGGGLPKTIGFVAQSLMQGWFGKNSVSPSVLQANLGMGGFANIDLQYLGLNPQQMTPFLTGYNQLIRHGYTPAGVTQLFQNAASNNNGIRAQAQRQLAAAGVTGVTSDLQKLKNNQAQQTQRSVNTAAGFDAALTQATDTLQQFNSVLNGILNHIPGGNAALGALGGAFGVMSGTNHGNIVQGLGGLGLLGLAGRGLFGGGGLGSILGGATGGGLSGAGSLLARLGPLAAAAGVAAFATKYHWGNQGTLWQMGSPGAGGHNTGWNSWSGLGNNIGNWLGDAGRMAGMIGQFGGATSAPVPSSSQSSKTLSMTNSGVSSSAVKAVNAAESQLGVPYVWGGETPGVGFDCSGLIQWAYRQAGVNLPRTSEQQWSALRRRMIPTNQVQEGDLVFMAGSDGTANSPGHVGMMINRTQLIEAPTTGQDVKIIGYDPKQWSHAARPSGRLGNVSSSGAGLTNMGLSALPGLYGNAGMGMGLGNYGSANEVDLISSTGGFMGGGLGAFSLGGLGGLIPTTAGNPNGSSARGSAGMGNGSKSITAEKAYAMALLRAKGWANQFGALNSIINAESSWRWNATNPTSGAYGIPQALPGSKMAAAGSDWRTNPDTQLRWLIDMYIPQRYGNPNNAWSFHQRNGWYGGGGWTNNGPGIRVVGDRGPEMQIDTGQGTLTINNAQTMSLLKSISNPQQTPWQNFTESKTVGNTIYPGISSGAKVNVSFGKQSICINVSATTDAQTAGQTIAQQIVNSIQNEQLWSAVAKGHKN